MKKINWKKVIKKLIAILVMLFVLVHMIPFTITKDINAIEIKLDDPSYLEERTIQVSGKYYLNLLVEDKFRGKIIISDYKITSGKMETIWFSEESGSLVYQFVIGKNEHKHPIKETYILGPIIAKPLLRNMAILLYNENVQDKNGDLRTGTNHGGYWDSIKGYCLVAEVNNREDALAVLKWHKVIAPDQE